MRSLRSSGAGSWNAASATPAIRRALSSITYVTAGTSRLLHGHACCQVAGLGDVATQPDGGMIREQLQRNHRDERREQLLDLRDREHRVGEPLDVGLSGGDE